jgi:hypothetical protein
MLTGRKRLPGDQPRPHIASLWRAAALIVIAAGAVTWLVVRA